MISEINAAVREWITEMKPWLRGGPFQDIQLLPIDPPKTVWVLRLGNVTELVWGSRFYSKGVAMVIYEMNYVTWAGSLLDHRFYYEAPSSYCPSVTIKPDVSEFIKYLNKWILKLSLEI